MRKLCKSSLRWKIAPYMLGLMISTPALSHSVCPRPMDFLGQSMGASKKILDKEFPGKLDDNGPLCNE